MLLAMSSTAVAFKLMADRGELTTPHGNIATAVLLLQDLLVVVCMVALPLLATSAGGGAGAGQSLVLGLVVVAGMILAGRYLAPRLLFAVVRTHNRELFLIVIVLLCLGSSALTGAMGWSLALGAFLAGLALSESEYATQTLTEVLPFRDTLASLFFISIGMLLDLRFLAGHLPLVLGIVLAVCAFKFISVAIPILFAGYPLRTAVLAGAAISQIGEFSFVLADRGRAVGLLNLEEYQTFLAAAVLTIALTPLFTAAAPALAEKLESWPRLAKWRKGRRSAEDEKAPALSDQVIIVGFGLTGRNLARVLKAVDIDYVILELNPSTVHREVAQGEPIHFGECSRPAVLQHLGVENARLLVIAISDPASSRRAVELARGMNPRLHILVRTRFLSEIPHLRRLGANTIIPEEFETSVEVFAQVLHRYEMPENLIRDLVERVRADHYEVLRDMKAASRRIALPHAEVLEKMEIKSCWIRDSSPAQGRSLKEVDLRSATGATLIAVRRAGKLHLNPGPDLCLQANDVAILVGDGPQTQRALCLLDPARPRAKNRR
jgi:CPA2 family monovalent cation:H+ antiporter-2